MFHLADASGPRVAGVPTAPAGSPAVSAAAVVLSAICPDFHSIARRTGRTDTDCVREALLDYIEELDDAEVATTRLAEPARLYSAAEVRRELDL